MAPFPIFGDKMQQVLDVSAKRPNEFKLSWRPGWPYVIVRLWQGYREASVLVPREDFVAMAGAINQAVVSGGTQPVEDADELELAERRG